MSNTLTTTTSGSSAVVKGAAVGVIGIVAVVALDNFMGWGLIDKFQNALPKKTGTKTDTTPGTGDAT